MIVTVLKGLFNTARSGMTSPLKSPNAMEMGLGSVSMYSSAFVTSKNLGPVVPAPRVAVSRTALPLVVFRNETVPVGAVLSLPPTVAVSLLLLPLALALSVVIDGQRPVTVSGAALEALLAYAAAP